MCQIINYHHSQGINSLPNTGICTSSSCSAPVTMKALLALGVVLAVSVALSSAACYTAKPKFNRETKTSECEHNGKLYLPGETWTVDCLDCSCGKKSMQCCSRLMSPIYDKETCDATLDKESCSYIVTKKDNPSEECEITGMVG
ncbi:beta-microseminoprotein-like [Dendrobates tinctorius]|uniref:beta-microseminoprotein-like n=1 Tax=Dendrobates tinctorius TaxID=92724 RepID=UPI003CCA27A1